MRQGTAWGGKRQSQGKAQGSHVLFVCHHPNLLLYYSHTCLSASHRKREHTGDGPSQRPGLLSERRMLQGGGRAEGECEDGSTVGDQRKTCPHPFLTRKSAAADPSHLSLEIHRELLETNEMNLRSAIYQL